MSGLPRADLGDAGRVERISRRSIGIGADHVELRPASLGRVLVTAADVRATPAEHVTTEELLACTRRSVDAARALLQGRLALRGAAVLVPEGVVAFVGGPRAGTTSVAGAYARRRSGSVVVDGVVAIGAGADLGGLDVHGSGQSWPLVSWCVLRRCARTADGPSLQRLEASEDDVRDLTFLRDFVPALATADEVRALGARLARVPVLLIEAAVGADLVALGDAVADADVPG